MSDFSSDEQLDLVARVRAVDGVTDVYSPHSALTRIPGLFAAATGTSDDRLAEVAVSIRDGVPVVAARIATSLADSTADSARRVADALLAHTPGDTAITIQVARIHGGG